MIDRPALSLHRLEIPEYATEQCDQRLLVFSRETARHLFIALLKDRPSRRQAVACLLRQRDQAAAAIGRIGLPPDDAVTLHAREKLRHCRLFDPCPARELGLRSAVPVFQGGQHRKLSGGETDLSEA